MVDERNIRKSSEYADRWLINRQRRHVRMVENSIKKLQDSIEDILYKLSTSNGRLEGLKVNLKQAQQIHKRIEGLYEINFPRTTRRIIDDFSNVTSMIQRSWSYLDEAIEFTNIDKKTFEILKNGYYADFLEIGTRQKNKVIQGVYDQVIANARFSDLVNTTRKALMGADITDVTGRSLAQYSRLYARDMIMDFSRNVTLSKAKDAGFDSYLYVGNIIATTRPFCKTRAGKVYTEGQINSWTYNWAGKKGPAMQFCGGWNCRHHWRPVRKEWLNGKKKLNIGDWNLENNGGS